MVKRPRAGGFALDSPVTPLPRPVGAGYGARRAAGKGPREAGGRNGLWCAPSARGCGARRAAPRAVLRLADEGGGAPSLGAGGRERPPGSRRPEWVVVRPVGAGYGARCRRDGRGESVRGAARREGPLQNRRTQGSRGAFGAAFCAGPRPAGGKREKRKGVCRRRLLRQTPSFSLSRSVLGMLCAGCSTALPWPVRPARRRRTPPARAPARPRPGPWPHTALPFRSS